MEQLTGVLNKLQDVLLTIGRDSLPLPQIVVVGDQSSGKSSVLESLVGKSFLPRGAGCVTRRPILLYMETISTRKVRGDEEVLDHVIFQNDSNIYTDFKKVMCKIEEEMERAAGPNKGICAEPISLKVFSRASPNLTLIDLPGLIKVPMGDQPPDIEVMLHDLIIKYISNPDAIILAIVTANTDVATSESLKIAREVDPRGERTLAVITKLDIMDEGTDAMELLLGQVIPVQLGVIGVVNRSQRDIIQGKTINEAYLEEMSFFQKNYPTLANKQGSFYLARTLEKFLVEHVKQCLPEIKEKVEMSINYHMSTMQTLNNPIGSPNDSLLQLLTSFATSYTSKIHGTSNELEMKELGGGARISYVFHEIFAKALDGINPMSGFTRSCILTALRNASGAKPSLFIPDSCFELLVKRQIAKLEPPSLRCIQLVYNEMERLVYNCTHNSESDMPRFPKLQQKIIEVLIKLLKSRLPETNDLVKKIIAIHSAYINTAHPDFKKIEPTIQGTTNTDVVIFKEDVPKDCIIIEQLISSYFMIVKKNIQDAVPKAIMHCLVNFVNEHLLSELVRNLYVPGRLDLLLEESAIVLEQRKYTLRMLDALEKANDLITDIKEGFIF